MPVLPPRPPAAALSAAAAWWGAGAHLYRLLSEAQDAEKTCRRRDGQAPVHSIAFSCGTPHCPTSYPYPSGLSCEIPRCHIGLPLSINCDPRSAPQLALGCGLGWSSRPEYHWPCQAVIALTKTTGFRHLLVRHALCPKSACQSAL